VQASQISGLSISDKDVFSCPKCKTRCIVKGSIFSCNRCRFVANVILCKCGCGETRLDRDSHGKYKQFIKYHHRRGKKHSPQSLEKIRVANLGDKNPQWKGDDVGDNGLHRWLRSQIPEPYLCEICNKIPPYDLANVTDIYSRNLENWKYLCRSCHTILDINRGIKPKPHGMRGKEHTAETRLKMSRKINSRRNQLPLSHLDDVIWWKGVRKNRQRFKCKICRKRWSIPIRYLTQISRVGYDLVSRC
jgi:hypothetical protein